MLSWYLMSFLKRRGRGRFWMSWFYFNREVSLFKRVSKLFWPLNWKKYESAYQTSWICNYAQEVTCSYSENISFRGPQLFAFSLYGCLYNISQDLLFPLSLTLPPFYLFLCHSPPYGDLIGGYLEQVSTASYCTLSHSQLLPLFVCLKCSSASIRHFNRCSYYWSTCKDWVFSWSTHHLQEELLSVTLLCDCLS